MNLETGTVIYANKGRKKETLDKFMYKIKQIENER